MARIDIGSEGLDAIIDGFEELSRGPSDPMRNEWRAASERFFAESQSLVHVLTGALKTTGTLDVNQDPDSVETLVHYGGPVPQDSRRDDMVDDVDYAVYEHRRGGNHAWLTNAWATSADQFPRGLERGFTDTWK